jgi:predicted DNA-binding protein
MRQFFDSMLRVRIPASLQARLFAAADRFARTNFDVAREAIALGLEHLARRTGDTPTPHAA